MFFEDSATADLNTYLPALALHDALPISILQHFSHIAAADDCRNTQFARDDRRVAGAATTIGDDRAGALHDRFPVRVGHVGDEHVARLYAMHFFDRTQKTYGASADLLADRAAFGEHRTLAALELVATQHVDSRAPLHGFRPRLPDVRLTVTATPGRA